MLVNRVMRLVTTSAACAALGWLVFGMSQVARADHGICSAANEYRDAALGLERHVHRLGHVDHYVKRLVSRLEDAACDFRAASHDLGNVARLNYQWDELQSLHARVEQAILTGCAANDPGLHQCWMSVAQSFQCLQTQMSYLRSGLPASPVPPWQSQRVPTHGHHHPYAPIYGSAPNWNPGNVPPAMGRPAYPAPAGPVVLPAAPFGSTLGTMPFPHSAARMPHGPSPYDRAQSAQRDSSRGELGAAIAIGLLQNLLNR